MDGVFSAHDWDNEYSESGEYAVSAEGISSLDIAWIAGGVDITPYNGEVISFSETSREDLSARSALRYGVEDGTLYIQYCRSDANDLPAKELTVLVPESLASGLGELSVSSISAAVDISGLEAGTAVSPRSPAASFTPAGQISFTSPPFPAGSAWPRTQLRRTFWRTRCPATSSSRCPMRTGR